MCNLTHHKTSKLINFSSDQDIHRKYYTVICNNIPILWNKSIKTSLKSYNPKVVYKTIKSNSVGAMGSSPEEDKVLEPTNLVTEKVGQFKGHT